MCFVWVTVLNSKSQTLKKVNCWVSVKIINLLIYIRKAACLPPFLWQLYNFLYYMRIISQDTVNFSTTTLLTKRKVCVKYYTSSEVVLLTSEIHYACTEFPKLCPQSRFIRSKPRGKDCLPLRRPQSLGPPKPYSWLLMSFKVFCLRCKSQGIIITKHDRLFS